MATCLDGFLANERRAAARLKRGGRTIIEPLDLTSADAELAVRVRGVQTDPEAWFHASGSARCL
jgi:hypothetical protein